MAVQSNRRVTITFTGDVESNTPIDALTNTNSPGGSDVVNLAMGANTINVPGGGTTVRAVTIIPPAENTVQITLKGVTGDTGVLLGLTDVSSIALAAGQASFCLTAASAVTGVRLLWS